MREALVKMGAPADLVIPIEQPSVEKTNEVMKQCDRILATGGTHHSLAEIAESVLQDERQRGLTRDRRAGLTLPEEVDLLASLQGI